MPRSQIPSPCEPIRLGDFFLEDHRFSAVYFLYDRGVLVYVGQSTTLRWWIETHLTEATKTFDAVAYIRCTSDRLTAIEAHYIRRLVPKYNACSIARKARDSGVRCGQRKPRWSAAQRAAAKSA